MHVHPKGKSGIVLQKTGGKNYNTYNFNCYTAAFLKFYSGPSQETAAKERHNQA